MVDGVLTVGTKNTVVDQNNVASQTDPLVKGLTTGSNRVGIGVKSYGGTFNYYDGKFVGTTNAKPDAPTDYEYRHRVLTSIDSDNNEQCVLDYVPQ